MPAPRPGNDATGPSGLPTVFDESFEGVGQEVGLVIWRVEKLKVYKKDHDEDCYDGVFFEGDSYIILQTKMRNNAFERHIFFWLGGSSSQDEQGVAAYKTVELDESLGGEPTQHREVQGHETGAFKALFKNGLRYKEGGVDTGFRHVDREAFETRLLHVKGRRNIVVNRVDLDPEAMNKGDVFILDCGRDIFQWNGPEASRLEKQKAMETTRRIRDEERGGKAKVHIIDADDDDEEFWFKFGCDKPDSISDATDDTAAEEAAKAAVKLYHLSDESGALEVEEIQERPLTRDMLNTKDAYVLDTGTSGIFGWVGKKASASEKANTMKYAMQFMKEQGYPNWTPVCRVVQNAETPLFKQHFTKWYRTRHDANASGMGGLAPANKRPAFRKKTFDSATMHAKREREQAAMPDDGTGKVTVWRIEKRQKVLVPDEMFGQFFGGDSYIVLYEYKDHRGKDAAFIYFWQGLKSSQDEKADSAILATQLDDEMGGYPVQVRVVQNKEPPHFYLIFKGHLVIHTGGVGSGFKNVDEADYYDEDGVRLFHIKATNEYNIRAIQVKERASSLNSGDCFVLETPKTLYLWFGNGCSKEERDFTKSIFKNIWNIQCPPVPEILMEGMELPDHPGFWEALGGKTSYGQGIPVNEKLPEPRLFQCSNDKGYFYAEECFDFDQEDLVEDDVMLLDCYNALFIWIGKGANAEERKESLTLAKNYVQGDDSGRKIDDTVITVINQGLEPPNFTCHFHAWDDDKWRNGKSYEDLKAEMATGNPQEMEVSLEDALEKYKPGGTIYTYEQLTTEVDTLPDVDKTTLEMYLSDEDFKTHFKMEREEFYQLAKWKQSRARKQAGL